MGKITTFIMELRRDGSFVQSLPGRQGKPTGALWRIEGDQFIISTKQPDGQISEIRGPYKLDGDHLTWTRGDIDTQINYTRSE